jgi:hypothetical protein
VTVQLSEEFDTAARSGTTHSISMATTMTELRWIITVVSVVLTVQFVSVECANNTTGAGKLKVHKRRDNVAHIATGYELDGRRVRVRVQVGKIIFFSPRRPNRLWGLPSIL